ncbi:MAG: VWA domain-containing protein [Steroidobacteraceae bacterium]
MLRRRRTDTFGLSFLDCICCGFGAVILFYVMMSAQGGLRRLHRTDRLKSEVNRLADRVQVGTRNLAKLENSLEAVQSEKASIDSSIEHLLAELAGERKQLSSYDAVSLAQRQHIEQLKSDIQELQAGERRLEAGALELGVPGQAQTSVPGASAAEASATPAPGPAAAVTEPRFITGVSLRGKRILILLDRSASMLHEDVVTVIRMRNASDDVKRGAAKWRRAVRIVDWLELQMPSGIEYQIYAFNTRAEPLVPGTAGSWLDSGDAAALVRNIGALRALVPQGGTSLVNALAAAKLLNPLPDQIILITDGLPTQGRTAGSRKYIDAGAREQLFDQAITVLPKHVPVDTVLLPMLGDVEAAHRFWALARLSGGTLLAPAKDWP